MRRSCPGLNFGSRAAADAGDPSADPRSCSAPAVTTRWVQPHLVPGRVPFHIRAPELPRVFLPMCPRKSSMRYRFGGIGTAGLTVAGPVAVVSFQLSVVRFRVGRCRGEVRIREMRAAMGEPLGWGRRGNCRRGGQAGNALHLRRPGRRDRRRFAHPGSGR